MTVAELIEHLRTLPPGVEVRTAIANGAHLSCSWELDKSDIQVLRENDQEIVVFPG